MDAVICSTPRVRRLLCSLTPLAAFAVVSASPAGAAVTEEVSIANSFGFLFDGSVQPTPKPGGSKEKIYRGKPKPTQSELGINYTATAGKDGFFFLHDNYCVGTCSTFSQTVITFTLHNTGDAIENLRFDSQITPGHIARILGGGGASASFAFGVQEVRTGGEPSLLYGAEGGVNSDGIFLNTGDLNFNGLTQRSTDQYEVLDWGTTNLSVGINRLAPGATTQVVYTATYMSSGNATCADILACPGVQVVFGDPRNNGAVIGFADRALGPAVQLDALDPRPVIGGTYAPTFLRAQFVPFNAPLPPDPGPAPVLTYDQLFQPRVVGVPEPATWAMMIGGFAFAGGAARRRRRRQVA